MTNREACINWIKEYFKDNPEGKAIIGISGGKDSTIDLLYHSTPSYDNVNFKALADNIQKVIDTAGCNAFRRNQ